MPATVIVGLQWGDEGKGKTTDFLAEQVSMAVRYQGGDNAGHTVVLGNEVFKLHLVPSGVLYPHISCVIGPGVVVNPATLIAELDMLAARGIDTGKVRVSRNAHLILPYHVAQDAAMEARLGGAAVGTTHRGIGPAYADRALRIGLRVEDLVDERSFRARLERVLPDRNALLGRLPGRRSSSSSSRSSPRRWPGVSASGRTWPIPSGWSRTPWPGATTSCSRAPRAPCSTSTTAAIPTSPARTRSPAAPAPGAGSARSRSTR